MTGTNAYNVVLQERDKRFFRELAMMRVVDREQAKIVAGFGSTTRVNVRLLGLTRAGFLKRFFLGTAAGGAKALYSLSQRGAQLVGVPMRGPQRRNNQALIGDFFVEHQLAVNEIYCTLKYHPIPVPGVSFHRWEAFTAPLTERMRLIPDGYVELETPAGILAAFLEVDLGSESRAVWKQKVQNYLTYAVSGESAKRFEQGRFRVLVVTPSERRLRSIRELVAETTDKLFWFASFETIRRDGFFAPAWLRPKGDRQPFLEVHP